MPVLTAVDVLGIQRFVFGSRRLRDVLAASWLVSEVTGPERLTERLPAARRPEVLVAAGGNAYLESATLAEARDWAAAYSRWLADEAPGLTVAVAHRPYRPGELALAIEALQVQLAEAKTQRAPQLDDLGVGVEARCGQTGLPATEVDEKELIGRRIATLRRRHRTRARSQWDAYRPAGMAFPEEIDETGRSRGESSLIGVVHVDGNGLGQLIRRWLDRCIEEGRADDEVRRQMRSWSGALDRAGRRVLEALVERLRGAVVESEPGRWDLRGLPADLSFRLASREGLVQLPLRPILLGGDDLTFLCDGRIALDLAAAALRAFEAARIPHLGPEGGELGLTACAGVAFVGIHAPFYRSARLADDLCRHAKMARRREAAAEGSAEGSWLDWHLGASRPGETVDDLRSRSYGGGALTLRPYALADREGRPSWRWLDEELLGPHPIEPARGLRGDPLWVESRGRIKDLARAVALDGTGALGRRMEIWSRNTPGLELPGKLPPDGRWGEGTPLLDAVELVDLHFRLAPASAEASP